jgi:hypothetical protein
MQLRTTRFDLAPRNMEILHPFAFANLTRTLKASWEEWKHIESNPSSSLRVTDHYDKRIFSMIPNSNIDDLIHPGCKFLAKVDVTNFYSSIYTHAIPWAVYGIEEAKSKINVKNDWANKLDEAARIARRKETTGVSVGPGTSAIIGEIMMGSVDHTLRDLGYGFQRYIDDYYYPCNTRERAETFVHDVRDALLQLKLAIHPIKTHIVALPVPKYPRWMRDLRTLSRAGKNTPGKLFDLLDHVIDSHRVVDEDASLRYALSSIEAFLSDEATDSSVALPMIDRLLEVGYLKPIAINTACRLLDRQESKEIHARKDWLEKILVEHVGSRRSDTSTWILYIALKNDIQLGEAAIDAIFNSGDSLSISLLASSSRYITNSLKYLEELEQFDPPSYIRDEHWLTYYQLRESDIALDSSVRDYLSEFDVLSYNDINFIDFEAVNNYLPTHSKPAVSGKTSSPTVGKTLMGGPYDI